jgi:phosphatidate cytidylyltransferase
MLKDALAVRALSAVVLALPVLAAVYYGWPYFMLLTAAAALILAWEWTRVCGGAAVTKLIILGAFLLAGVMTAAWDRPGIALAILGLGFALLWVLPPAEGEPASPRGRLWLASGALYVGLPCVALIWLRGDSEAGRQTLIWLFAVVWAADSGAYALGRMIGGPLLAPMISPKKTWSGLIGGVACAGAAGAALAALFGKTGLVPLTLAGAAIGAVAEGGDLIESWIKRHFQVKDASNIIPGHGGLMDRVDGLLVAAVAMALLELIGKESVLTWF